MGLRLLLGVCWVATRVITWSDQRPIRWNRRKDAWPVDRTRGVRSDSVKVSIPGVNDEFDLIPCADAGKGWAPVVFIIFGDGDYRILLWVKAEELEDSGGAVKVKEFLLWDGGIVLTEAVAYHIGVLGGNVAAKCGGQRKNEAVVVGVG